MTDGIIQKVFDKYIKIAKTLDMNTLQYERIQQEIIVEIKKELDIQFDTTEPDIMERLAIKNSVQEIYFKLIGDNQE